MQTTFYWLWLTQVQINSTLKAKLSKGVIYFTCFELKDFAGFPCRSAKVSKVQRTEPKLKAAIKPEMEIHLLRTFMTFVLHSYLLGSFDTTKKRERRGFSYIVTHKKLHQELYVTLLLSPYLCHCFCFTRNWCWFEMSHNSNSEFQLFECPKWLSFIPALTMLFSNKGPTSEPY